MAEEKATEWRKREQEWAAIWNRQRWNHMKWHQQKNNGQQEMSDEFGPKKYRLENKKVRESTRLNDPSDAGTAKS